MAELSESEKVELILGQDNFSRPAEVSGPKAWARMISNLLFMHPGAYPTDPEMGCDLGRYDYAFLDDVKNEIEELITDQVSKYFSDLPFTGVTVSKQMSDTGEPIMVIILEFESTTNETDTVVIASDKISNDIARFVTVV